MSTPKKEIKTPIKGRRLASTPITPQTPTVDSSIRRRVSDILVNIHKCVQIWEVDNQSSFNAANTLANLYGQWNTVQDSKNMEGIMSEECKRKYRLKLLKTREDLFKQLNQHKQKLRDLLCKMNSFLENIKAIYYLGLVASNSDVASSDGTLNDSDLQELNYQADPVIFSTWPAEKFIEILQFMLSDYTKEYMLKMKFYEIFFNYRVDDNEDINLLTECVSVWLHQPYIGDKCKEYLDSMLVEAELK